MFALLPFLLAATPVAGDSIAVRRPVSRVASASVRIIRAERFKPELVHLDTRKPDRQVRLREAKPLIEFF
jgi:hypothetical protein